MFDFKNLEEFKKAIRTIYSTANDEDKKKYESLNSENKIAPAAKAFNFFINEVKIGDIIIANSGRKIILGMGVVKSSPKFDETCEFSIYRSIEWKKVDIEIPIPETLKGKLGRTIEKLTEKEYELIFPTDSITDYLIFSFGDSKYSDKDNIYIFHKDTKNANWVKLNSQCLLYYSSSFPDESKKKSFVGVATVEKIENFEETLEKNTWLSDGERFGVTREKMEENLRKKIIEGQYKEKSTNSNEIIIPALKAYLNISYFPKSLKIDKLCQKYPDFDKLYRSSKNNRIYISMTGISRIKEGQGKSKKEWFELIMKEGNEKILSDVNNETKTNGFKILKFLKKNMNIGIQ